MITEGPTTTTSTDDEAPMQEQKDYPTDAEAWDSERHRIPTTEELLETIAMADPE